MTSPPDAILGGLIYSVDISLSFYSQGAAARPGSIWERDKVYSAILYLR